MSASREKKSRQTGGSAGASVSQVGKEDNAAKHTKLYGIVIALVAVAAVFILVWNSGMIQRSSTAVTINGESYSPAQVQYYYHSTLENVVNQYVSAVGMPPFDYSKSLRDQVYDQESGKSWHDYILEEAVKALTAEVALADKAKEEGFELSQASKDNVKMVLDQLETNWAINGFTSRDAFMRATFGPYMTYDALVELLNMRALAGDYAVQYVNSLEYDQAAFDAYYQENAKTLDTYTVSQAVFQAKVDTVDAEGNPLELTDEEKKTALAEAEALAKADAQAFQSRLEAGEDFEALAAEFSDKLYHTSAHEKRTGSSVNSSYVEWAQDDARKAGDITMTEYTSDTVHNYYVALFEGRELDRTKTANVRHILVAAATDAGQDQPTQAQYDEAYAKAEKLLADWEAGEATEEAFAALAKENSADPGSAANGGLIANVNSTSTYVPEFQNWCMDPARKPGDTGLVQNTGSATKGWHIMYYVKDGEPVWKQNARSDMVTKDYSAWEAQLTESYEIQLGSGVKYVK